MKLQGKRIIFRKLEQPKKESAILLANEETARFYRGTVVAAGTETTLKPNCNIFVSTYQAGEVEWEGEKLLMCLEEEIIGVE